MPRKSDKKTDPHEGLALGEKPTLKTISRLSGLAVPTVSRALNDAPDIGAETKIRVRRIASEIGYVPNRAGVRLRTGRTNVIGLVLGAEVNMMNHTAQLMTSLTRTLRDTPYHVVVSPRLPDEELLRPIRYLVENRAADGIIFNATEPNDPRVEYLLQRRFPFATHGRDNLAHLHPYFDYDNKAFGNVAIRHLAARGRRNIAVILPPLHQNYGMNMYEGVTETGAALGVLVRPCDRITSDSSVAEVAGRIREILSMDPTIDAIVTASPTGCMAAAEAAEAMGRHIGFDIDIYGKEAIPFLKLFRREILVLHENVGKAGEFLAHAVLKAIAEPQAPPMQGLDTPTFDTQP